MTNDYPAAIAVCPRCKALLAPPAEADLWARVQCPECGEPFALADALRPLRTALLAAPLEPPQIAPAMPEPLPSPSWSLPELASNGVHVWVPPGSIEERVAETPQLPEPIAAEAPQVAPQLAAPQVEAAVDPSAATVAMAPADTVRLDRLDRLDVDQLAIPAAEPAAEASFAERAVEAAAAIDDNDIDVAVDGDDQTHVAAAAEIREFDSPFSARPRRRRASGVRTLVGIVGGGAGGLLLGGYILLWLRGGAVDVFAMRQWLPNALLPPALRTSVDDVSRWAADEPAPEDGGDARGEADDSLAQVDAPDAVQVDSAVVPATAAEPGPDATPADAQLADATAAAEEVRWPVTPVVGDLLEPRLYSLEEVTEAVKAGEIAAAKFGSGDLSQPDAVRDMGQAYIELCALAERFTLTDPAAFGGPLITQHALAKAALRSAAAPARRGELAVVAARWLEHDERKNAGVVLVGRVRDMRAVGPWTEYFVEVELSDRRVEVPVLLDQLKFSTGDEMGVSGVIVADPQRQIAGYVGDAPQTVIAGDAFDPSTISNEASEASESPEFDALRE